MRLNPFFVRAGARTMLAGACAGMFMVLIPSSSGLVLELDCAAVGVAWLES